MKKTCALLAPKYIESEEKNLSDCIVGRRIVWAQKLSDGYNIGLDNDQLILVTGDFVIGLVDYTNMSIN